MFWGLRISRFIVASDNTLSRMERHLGSKARATHILSHDIQPLEQVNLHRVLERWRSECPQSSLFGAAYSLYSSQRNLTHFAQVAENIAPVEREQIEVDNGESAECVTAGIYLLRFRGAPIVVMLGKGDGILQRRRIVEIMACESEIARDAMAQLLDEAKRNSVFLGKNISLERNAYLGEEFQVRFHSWPAVTREEIILPDSIMRVLERNVLGMLEHADKLRRSGWSNRHGILLHGPPGVGKTLAIRYLAQACKNHTVIMMSGKQITTIRESFDVARKLAPSIVVIEDVDLIAQERSTNNQNVFLCELMDEMDGLGTKTECIIILTTNRPEVLEPALAARPGRVDQAIEFPLPDESCRRKLFELYGKHLDMQWLDLDLWIEKTDGASPAFIAELLRKATVFAAERGEAIPLKIRSADLDSAIRELVFFGGELTRRLLGFRDCD